MIQFELPSTKTLQLVLIGCTLIFLTNLLRFKPVTLLNTMGILSQAKVTPLPTGLNLHGKTIIITGASAGMGLECARQVLALNASTVVLAVRNTSKGEDCKKALLVDPAVKTHNKNATVKVMKLDTADYASVQSFAKAVKAKLPVVDHLILNAGIGLIKYEISANGHEMNLQVNYLSNVLLILELLPHLEGSAAKTGSPARITWVGSRTHYESTLPKKAPVLPNETVIGHMDDQKYFFPFQKYNDSKMMAILGFYELGKRLDRKKVLLNMLCPGMVDTAMSDVLPIYLRFAVNILKSIRARPVEQGAWLIINAMAVAGPESHGEFLLDKTIQP